MTIAEMLKEGAAFLDERGSPSARLDAEVLLAYVLGVRRVDLYAHPARPLTAGEEATCRALLERRARQEPVAYLLGRKEFYGLTLAVGPDVMVPRPETEVLVERALERARSLGEVGLRVADIGTGSACITVALAHHLAGAQFYAVEVSPEAGRVAQENLRRHGVQDRVVFLQGDLCEPLPEAVDLLLCNPPYTVWETLPTGITAYEPRIALDGGAAGLDIYRRLLPQVPACLRAGGFALFEVGDGQAEAVLALAREPFAGARARTYPDYAGVERVAEIGPYEAGQH